MNNKNPTPGEIVIMAAGAVAVIGSFLPFFDVDTGFGSVTFNAWSDGSGRPLSTLIVLFVVAAGVLVALTKFANVQVPTLVGFSFLQILLVLGLFATIQSLAYLIADTLDKGIGFWLLILSSIASLVGAILYSNERRSVGPGPA